MGESAIITEVKQTEEAEGPLKNKSPTVPKIIIFSDKIKIGIVEDIIKRGVSHFVGLPFFIFYTGGER